MPGRLVMDQHAVQGPDGLKKEPGQATIHTNGLHQLPSSNGINHSETIQEKAVDASGDGSRPGALPTNGSLPLGPGKDKDKQSATQEQNQDRLPPELEHWAHTYVPMGKLLERVAQQCYSDLTETVDSMADMAVQQQHHSPAVNGASSLVGSNAPPDPSSESVEKKLRLMNFAQEHKDRFLKLLVLSNWARNMEDMDKLIELRMWLQKQDDASSTVADAIIRLKHNMIPAKMPNPNIQGALELLSTGKAPWMPDLGYIPAPPLTAQQLLRTLRDMNFALAVRLNLHEELPEHFQTYSIANGRATFVVPEEFEVDLAVADEDAESPFYFIDLRLLFSNSPTLTDGAVRASIEGKVNEILATQGLSGCYLYLHDFVLTHKINLLRRQAFDLARGKWNECLRVESIHRDFVVHYWTGQPGGKSWIHVGVISSAKSNMKSSSRHSQINIRWVREGQDSHVDLDVNGKQISMEQILEEIIASHIRWRLEKIDGRLRSLAGATEALDTRLKPEQQRPNSSLLEMQFGRSRAPLSLRISPVTGSFSISPASPITMETEKKLNSDNSPDAGQILSVLHCKLLQDQVRKHAQRLGWLPLVVANPEDIAKMFGRNVVRCSVFSPRHWGEEWAIALTVSLSGEKWWVVHADARAATLTCFIKSAEPLPLDTMPTSIHRANLVEIESISVAQISFSNITKQLRRREIQYELRQAQPATKDNDSPVSNTTVLYLNFNDLLRPRSSRLASTWKPWCQEVLILTHHGMCEDSSEEPAGVMHVLKAALTKQAYSNLRTVGSLNGRDEMDISFSEKGVCALRLRSTFGEGLLDLIEARLKRVERLNNYIYVAHQAHAQLLHASVTRLVVQYSKEPSLTVELKFADGGDSGAHLSLHASEDGDQVAKINPHRRIQTLLQMILKPADSAVVERGDVEEFGRFQSLLRVLAFTLPLMRGISKLEDAHASTLAVRGSAYAYNHYRLVYTSPLPDVKFDITMRKKDSREVWIVSPLPAKAAKDKEMAQALHSVWSSSGDGWSGLTTGAYAEKDGIESLLDRLDATVRELAPTKTGESSGEQAAESRPEVVILD